VRLPQRIALCITELRMGGAERCLAQLAAQLDRERFDPIVVSLAPPPPAEELSCAPILTGAGIEPRFLHARRWWDLPRVLRQLEKIFRQHQIPLVQSFLFHANFVCRWAAWRVNRRHTSASSPSAGRCRVAAGIRVAERGQRWHLWLDRRTQHWVDRYVCVSQGVADFTVRTAGIRPEKIVVIPNGIAWQHYPADHPADLSRLGIPPGRRVIVAVGRLEEQKGFGWLISAAAQWLAPLADCDLLVVGDGPMRHRLQQEAIRQGLADRVHFAELRADVPEILAASSLLVLPSRWEGMPNVVLEAMASGLPVLATQVEGVMELLGPAADLQTIAYGDTSALAAKLALLLHNPILARQLGQTNQQRVRQHFGLDRMVQAYQDLWTQLLEASS